MQTSMQTSIKTEFCGSGSYNGTPEKRALQREKQLLTYVIKATARDQEKNIMISKLQREISEAVEDFDALKTEVKLKDKMLHAKEDELETVKSENEALKQQLQLLIMTKKANVKFDDTDKKKSLKPDSANINNGDSPSTSPRPKVSRKRSIKKQKDIGVAAATNLFYNLRKKTKK